MPGGQLAHREEEFAPGLELKVPAAQLVHVEEVFAPKASLYVPAGQLVHWDWDWRPVVAPKEPAMHGKAAAAGEPIGQK